MPNIIALLCMIGLFIFLIYYEVKLLMKDWRERKDRELRGLRVVDITLKVFVIAICVYILSVYTSDLTRGKASVIKVQTLGIESKAIPIANTIETSHGDFIAYINHFNLESEQLYNFYYLPKTGMLLKAEKIEEAEN